MCPKTLTLVRLKYLILPAELWTIEQLFLDEVTKKTNPILDPTLLNF